MSKKNRKGGTNQLPALKTEIKVTELRKLREDIKKFRGAFNSLLYDIVNSKLTDTQLVKQNVKTLREIYLDR